MAENINNQTSEGQCPDETKKQTQLEGLTKFILDQWRQSTFLVMLFGYVGYYICRMKIFFLRHMR